MAKKQPIRHKEPEKKFAPVTPKKKSSFWENVERNPWWLLGSVTLLALILRVWGAGKVSFWFDEYLHVLPAADFLRGKGLHNIDGFNGVFTTWVEIVAMGIFGINETTARVAMSLFAAASVIPMYFIAKKLFNSRIAFTAIFLFAISLYAIYWGRTVRNYATFLPFYLWMHWLLLNIFEGDIAQKKDFKIASGISINIKTFAWLALSFILSLLNHQLTVFIIFGWLFYGSVVWLGNVISGEKKFLNKYTIFVPLLCSFGLLFSSAGNMLAKKFLGVLLPPNIVNGVVPDLSRIVTLWKTVPFESFDVYMNVLKTDGNYLYILAIIGFVISFIKSRRSALYLSAHFVFLLILFSFVFREPAVSRYLYFIIPFYFMAVAYGIWWLIDKLCETILKKQALSQTTFVFILVLISGIFLLNPKNLKAFLNNTEHGQVVDRNISEWYYTNWKSPIEYVQQNMSESDVVLSTVPNAIRFYMGIDTAKLGWFRQMIYDGIQKKYVQNTPDGKKVSGYTTEEFMSTVKNNPRGWLLADYYFYNVMTDPQARQFAIEHLDYHFGASRDGSVQVFSWDNSKPKTEETPILVELGKPLGRSQSDEKSFNLNLTGQDKVLFIFDEEGIDVSGEAVIQINGGQMFPIPKPENSRGWGKEYATMEIPAQYLNNGSNKAQFYYNPQVVTDDIRPGFVIYNVRMR
ncbi:MAG: glycosyltransferase family 39 protein [Bacteroidia bacterium]|nr:glycosyltransferase family 39 protein [Bacteroidia bacterium]MCO5252973.1 glycosyltransferase family 39 protein [Bacteroidota bacterium]